MSKKKVIGIVIGVIVAVVLIVIGGGAYAMNHFYSKMDITDTLNSEEAGIGEEVADKEKKSGVINIAIFGIDKNGDQSDGRSDAMKVISLDMENKTIKMSSFQRDTLIYIPEPQNDFDKLNHAFSYGGAPLSIKTLNYNFDLDITRYVAFNFEAVETIIDKIDGIELEIKEEEIKVTNDYIRGLNGMSDSDIDAELITHSGVQPLTGRQALAYMRNRYVGSDFARMDRQSKVIEAMINKVKNQSFTDLLSLLEPCLPYVQTNIPMNEIISMGTALLSFDLTNIEQIQVPQMGREYNSISYNGYNPLYVMDDYQALVRELHEFIYDDPNYQPSQTVIETEQAIYDTFGRVE